LTPNHLIFTKENDFIQAKQVKIGQTILTMKEYSKVTNISNHIEKGFIAPLTESGTLIVNGIHTSCYTIRNHNIAHLIMKPIVWLHYLKKLYGIQTHDCLQNQTNFYLVFLRQSGIRSFGELLSF
jgi:hypothetical protein